MVLGHFLHFIGDHLRSAWLCNAQVLLTLVASPYLYTDKASDFVQEASTLQATASKQDADDTSVPVSHIDGQCRSVSVLGSEVSGGGTLDRPRRALKATQGANEHPLRGVKTTFRGKESGCLSVTEVCAAAWLRHLCLCGVCFTPGAGLSSSHILRTQQPTGPWLLSSFSVGLRLLVNLTQPVLSSVRL